MSTPAESWIFRDFGDKVCHNAIEKKLAGFLGVDDGQERALRKLILHQSGGRSPTLF